MGLKIALIGNPNCGKTTLFNKLTGYHGYVGNWPGVTVEKKEGFLKIDKNIKLIDMPGIYSLSPYTDEEVVSRDFLFKGSVDAIFNIVDATNLKRSLYLTLQLLELNIPMVVAISMMDRVKKQGGAINFIKLYKRLGCEVVELSRTNFELNFSAIESAKRAYYNKNIRNVQVRYEKRVEYFIDKVKSIFEKEYDKRYDRSRFEAIKFLERDEKFLKTLEKHSLINTKVKDILDSFRAEFNGDGRSIFIKQRYLKIEEILKDIDIKKNRNLEISDRIDAIFTNRFLAIPIFIVLVGFIYCFCINLIGQPICRAIENFFKDIFSPFLQDILARLNVSQWLNSLVVDGVVSGVGTVLTFVPQVFTLFLFLSILEDCGYMARVAFILDKLLFRFGLSGKSVISFLLSSGCGVNGILSTKTIKRSDVRFLTMVTTTFVPCNAKLPIMFIICSRIFGGSIFAFIFVYLICVLAIFVFCFISKNRVEARNNSNFLMELGPYSLPSAKDVLRSAFSNVWAFVVKAGSAIFLASVFTWFLLNFGIRFNKTFYVIEQVQQQEDSFLANIGAFIAPIFYPLGFSDWRAVVATISGIFAKENIVNTLGVIFKSINGEIGDVYIKSLFIGNSGAFSFLIFNLLCAPCVAAIAAIYKQTMSFKKTAKVIFFQTLVAYIAAFVLNGVYDYISIGLSDSFVLRLNNFVYENLANIIISILLLVILVFIIKNRRSKNCKSCKKCNIKNDRKK